MLKMKDDTAYSNVAASRLVLKFDVIDFADGQVGVVRMPTSVLGICSV